MMWVRVCYGLRWFLCCLCCCVMWIGMMVLCLIVGDGWLVLMFMW